MIDNVFGVKRYIAYYAKISEKLVGKIDISSFNIFEMRARYSMKSENDPMYDCYPIDQSDIEILKGMVSDISYFNFDKYDYFFESSQISVKNTPIK